MQCSVATINCERDDKRCKCIYSFLSQCIQRRNWYNWPMEWLSIDNKDSLGAIFSLPIEHPNWTQALVGLFTLPTKCGNWLSLFWDKYWLTDWLAGWKLAGDVLFPKNKAQFMHKKQEEKQRRWRKKRLTAVCITALCVPSKREKTEKIREWEKQKMDASKNAASFYTLADNS